MLKIWDLPIRVYHWLQAILFIGLVVTGYEFIGAEQAHLVLGLALFIALLWRIIWGIVGSDTARFVNFLPSFQQLIRYVTKQQDHYVGHNPLGALMVVLLIFLLLLQAVSGVYISEFIDGKGILGRNVFRAFETFHTLNAIFLTGLSVIHILVIFVYQLQGNPLINVMFTGHKMMPSNFYQPKMMNNTNALLVLAVCIVLVILLIS